MSRTMIRRLDKLEGSLAPAFGHYHVVYARDEADYRAQRAKLIAAGRAKSDELIFEEWLAEGEPAREPETKPWTMTHDEWVSFLNEAEPR
jgi:hypothetical protein